MTDTGRDVISQRHHSLGWGLALQGTAICAFQVVSSGGCMNENENITKWEDRFTEDKEEVANMDKDDFLNLLMESRIIQAS